MAPSDTRDAPGVQHADPLALIVRLGEAISAEHRDVSGAPGTIEREERGKARCSEFSVCDVLLAWLCPDAVPGHALASARLKPRLVGESSVFKQLCVCHGRIRFV